VPSGSQSGTNSGYVNPYNGGHQYSYVAKHNPMVFFSDSNQDAANYAPLQQLSTDLTNNTVAQYNWITPDQYNDMHSALSNGFTYNGVHYTGDQAAIAEGDNFLAMMVPMIEASQAFQDNGAIVIWWDETDGGDNSSYTLPEIIISPDAIGNAYTNTNLYTHSSDLATMEDIFGLGQCLGASCGANSLSGLFVAGAIPQGVPEPASWTMLAVGLVGCGAASTAISVRRRSARWRR
jgi:hypothetical protein